MNTALMFSTGKDDWQTPPELFAELDAEFRFNLDVAATATNSKCEHFYGEKTDGLMESWHEARPFGERPVCWCNPPYSRPLQKRFIEKAAYERRKGVTTVMLLPARTDTKAFHAHIWDAEKHQPRPGVEIRFLKGRLQFVGAKSKAPFPSMVIIFKPLSLLEHEGTREKEQERNHAR